MSDLRFVRHPKKPDWGPGIVVEDDRKSLTVVFEDRVGEVRLAKKVITVTDMAEEEISDTCRLRYLPIKVRSTTRSAGQPTTFPILNELFLGHYPEAFLDPGYSRGVKEDLLQLARNLLCKENLEPLIKANDYEAIFEVAKQAAQVSKIVHKYEQNRLASLPAEHIESFAKALYEQLHGEGNAADAFDGVASLLHEHDAGKWPICTFFLYVSDPVTQVYIKPNTVKTIAASVGYEIRFDNAPNSRTFGQVCRLYGYIAERLEAVGTPAADTIDVQNFWVAATGG